MAAKVVGQVPLEMFADVREAAGIDPSDTFQPINFLWRPEKPASDYHQGISEAAGPLISLIQEANPGPPIKLVDVSVRVEHIPPSGIAYFNGRHLWHRDGMKQSNNDRYVTSDGLCTQFPFSKVESEPGAVVHFRRELHRPPRNKTRDMIFRTWIRTTIMHTIPPDLQPEA